MANLTGTEGQTLSAFTSWPVPLPSGWTIHSVDPGYPSAFDWYAGQHAVLGQGNYVKIGTTYYYVSYSRQGRGMTIGAARRSIIIPPLSSSAIR